MRHYRPLWWRSFRYLELTVDTLEEPLQLQSVSATFTAYPFDKRATFQSDGPPWLDRVLETGSWTNQLSSHETYLDAYYEQLQYVGDTRIEALVSLFETGDARLMRNAIEQIDSSRTPDGLTFSRAPTRLYQYTPTFSLLWIGMLHDYWRYVNDPDFVREMLPGIHAILGWFERLQGTDGTLVSLPYYNFLDSDVKWNAKALGPYECQLLQAFQWATELEQAFGGQAAAAHYRAKAAQLRNALHNKYWDPVRNLFSDDPAHKRFSQHMNALAILTHLVQGKAATNLMNRTLQDRAITQCTIYFRYYLNRALVEAGMGERYIQMLQPWSDLLDQGVTAWPESEAKDARSDCHGWGDHPNIEIYRTVLGVDSAAPGFSRVHIEPHLGPLHYVTGSVPLPAGLVRVHLTRQAASGVVGFIDSPVEGVFVWNGTRLPVRVGENTIQLGAGTTSSAK